MGERQKEIASVFLLDDMLHKGLVHKFHLDAVSCAP